MNPQTGILINLKNAINAIEKILASLSLLLLLIFTIIQLLARNFFDYGFPQLDIISRHLVLFILFMGAGIVSENNNHIKIDILSTTHYNTRTLRIEKPFMFLASITCFIFTWYSANFWLDEFKYAQSNELLSAYFSFILPFGFIILSLHFLLLSITGFSHNQISIEEE